MNKLTYPRIGETVLEHTLPNGLRICIELKKDANANLVLNQLFRYTQLQDTYGVINLALVNGIPKELSLKQILEAYLEHQAQQRPPLGQKKTEYPGELSPRE